MYHDTRLAPQCHAFHLVLMLPCGITFKHDDKATYTSSNLMDKWIVSFTQSLLAFVHQEMDHMLLYINGDNSPPPLPPTGYRLYTVVPRLVRFIDQLTN